MQEEKRFLAVFFSSLSYCLHVTLLWRLRALTSGLALRALLEKFAIIQMLDVYLPTTDKRIVVMKCYTQPKPDVELFTLINTIT